MRRRATLAAVWLAYGLALAASYGHVRRAYAQLEPDAGGWAAWAAAGAVELGTAALALALAERARRGRRDRRLWAGLCAMASLGALANADAAAAVLHGGARVTSLSAALDPLDVLRAVVMAATLPALVLFLAAAADALATDAADATPAYAPPALDPAQPSPVVALEVGETRAAGVNGLLDAAGAAPLATLRDLAGTLGTPYSTVRTWAAVARDAGLMARRAGRWHVSPARVVQAAGAAGAAGSHD